MAKIPLIGAAYQARSLIAEAQRCVNVYPERNPEDAPFPFTHYPTPGLTLFATPPTLGVGRGLYRATNGVVFAGVGNKIYQLSNSGIWTSLGSIMSLSTPLSMQDSGIDLVIVDGSGTGYTMPLSGAGIVPITDPAFFGSVRADYLDTFFIFNKPGTQQFYYSKSNTVAFNPLNIAAKTGYPDGLVAAIVMHREIWLIGKTTTEVWYNTGASDITFGIMPGVFVEHGCIAPYSIAKEDLQIFWLSQDLQGNTMVLMGAGYKAEKISTHAIDAELQKYPAVSDAIGFTYQQGGHVYYVLNFPSGDTTWCYDVTSGLWHQRASIDNDGTLHRALPMSAVNAYGLSLCQDYKTGVVYFYDQANFTDNGTTVPRIRSFPHIKSQNTRITYRSFIADMEVGQATGTLVGSAPLAWLRFSDDGGFSWSNAIEQPLGSAGQYRTSVKWNRLGMARDRIFELSWSASVKTALNGAFIDPLEHRS